MSRSLLLGTMLLLGIAFISGCGDSGTTVTAPDTPAAPPPAVDESGENAPVNLQTPPAAPMRSVGQK